MTLSRHSIQSYFRCSTDVVSVIWLPAVRFQWPHVSQVDDDLTEMLCSLSCNCPRLCLSHSKHIQWTTIVVVAAHGCSILPFLGVRRGGRWLVKFFAELACRLALFSLLQYSSFRFALFFLFNSILFVSFCLIYVFSSRSNRYLHDATRRLPFWCRFLLLCFFNPLLRLLNFSFIFTSASRIRFINPFSSTFTC